MRRAASLLLTILAAGCASQPAPQTEAPPATPEAERAEVLTFEVDDPAGRLLCSNGTVESSTPASRSIAIRQALDRLQDGAEVWLAKSMALDDDSDCRGAVSAQMPNVVTQDTTRVREVQDAGDSVSASVCIPVAGLRERLRAALPSDPSSGSKCVL